jgi:hypothetical protein
VAFCSSSKADCSTASSSHFFFTSHSMDSKQVLLHLRYSVA